MDESADFRRLVASPLISREEQGRAVAAILDRLKAEKVTRNFAGVVVKNGRLDVLPKIIAAYNRLLADERGEVTASVTTPRKLDETQLKSVSGARSEEHTSELQSLMRSSYAVFCLKKKNKNTM